MKILINTTNSKEVDKITFAERMHFFLSERRINIPFQKEWKKIILIDEKLRDVIEKDQLDEIMDHIGYIGNVRVLNRKQFVTYVEKIEYPNASFSVAQHVKDMFERPLRNPCKYCGKKHADYPCEEQLAVIKQRIDSLSPEKRICKGCEHPIPLCVCPEHEKEKECHDC